MTDSNKGSEDEPWSEEDVEGFMENGGVEASFGDSSDDSSVHPGATWTGIVLTLTAIYGLYIQELMFVLYVFVLMVVLALGSKSISNR